MTRFLSIFSFLNLLLLAHPDAFSQMPDDYRWEISGSGSGLRSSDVSPTGWFIRQQLTYFPHRNVGVSAGVGWGKLDDLSPLKTGNAQELYNLFYRQHNATELNLVLAPVRSRRQTVRLSAGLALWRTQAMTVDSAYVSDLQRQQYEIIPRFTDARRLVPQVGLGYQVNVSPRWLIGLEARAYWTGGGKTATTVGVTTAYRFRLSADSLGIRRIDRQDLKAGIRLGATHSVGNGRSPSEVYRTRLVGGIWGEVPISLTWFARGEISYAQRGYRVYERRQGNTRHVPTVSSQNFLDWTILFSHEVAYRWRLFVGPQLAMFLNGKAEADGEPEEVRRRSFGGMVVGTAVQLSDRLQLDGRYQRDVFSLSTNQGGGLHGFQLGVNYFFKP
ncbi:hypothetical protein ACFQ4C_27025 [Larkinella insperata]|uniref:PorT family protein n=1 Tax=Larkinella insperata TaxID=332158 RepID=A0ABW3QB53_9BACT|nr:hypothetical protein [Larkinella insperata]